MYENLNGLDDITHMKIDNKIYQDNIYEYSFKNNIALTGSDNCQKTNYFSIHVYNRKDKTIYKNSFVTSLGITEKNIQAIARIGRNRWKIENEAFNILKNRGYNLEHNFGHGKIHLANLFIVFNLIVFAVHNIWLLFSEDFKLIKSRINSRTNFFHFLNAALYFKAFKSWDSCIKILANRQRKKLSSA